MSNLRSVSKLFKDNFHQCETWILCMHMIVWISSLQCAFCILLYKWSIYYLQPCPSCFASFPTNSKSKNSILGTNLDQMGNKASINIPSSIRQYLSNCTEKYFDLRNYTSEDSKKLRASRIMLGSGEDANEPTSTKRDMSPTY